jgi:hypothetical protein
MRWPVVPQGLQRAAVAPGTGPPVRSYGMDAAFMSFQLHGSGNHAVRVGGWRGGWGWDRGLFPWALRAMARRGHTKINLSGIVP